MGANSNYTSPRLVRASPAMIKFKNVLLALFGNHFLHVIALDWPFCPPVAVPKPVELPSCWAPIKSRRLGPIDQVLYFFGTFFLFQLALCYSSTKQQT